MLDLLNVNVLFIEDDEDSIKITKELLSRSEHTKFSIDTSSTLTDALDKLKECHRYDVILLDLVLPNGEGLSVFKKVKSVCNDKPIVIVSGYEDKALECVRHGAQDYLVKPYYNAKALSRSIRYAIERHNWEKKYKRLVESTHAAIYEIDFVSNSFTYINDVGLREIGYTMEEFLYLKPSDFLTNDSLERWLYRLDCIQRGDCVDNIEEYQVKKKDGSLMWILITADYKYENGYIVGASVVAIDITEKKNKESQLESIYKTAPVAIGLLKNHRIIVEVNDRLCQMLEYKKEELINQNAIILYPSSAEYKRVGKIKYEKIITEGIGIVETKWKTKSGKILDVLLTSTYMDSSDPTRGVTFSALDITKTKNIEREIEYELNKRLDSWKSEVGIDFQNLNRLENILSL